MADDKSICTILNKESSSSESEIMQISESAEFRFRFWSLIKQGQLKRKLLNTVWGRTQDFMIFWFINFCSLSQKLLSVLQEKYFSLSQHFVVNQTTSQFRITVTISPAVSTQTYLSLTHTNKTIFHPVSLMIILLTFILSAAFIVSPLRMIHRNRVFILNMSEAVSTAHSSDVSPASSHWSLLSLPTHRHQQHEGDSHRSFKPSDDEQDVL